MNTIYETINFNNKHHSVICRRCVMGKLNFSRIHWHENIELIYVLKPTSIYYNGEEITGAPGDIIFINSNILHDFKALSKDPSCYECLIIDVNLCNFLELDVKNTFVERVIKDKKAANILLKIIMEMKSKKPYYISSIKTLTCELLIYLYRNYETLNDYLSVNPKNMALVKNILEYIDTNYKNNITLDDIAKSMEYSKFYLIHTFKKVTGFTLLDYINTVKIKEATRLLNEGKYSVNEIALYSGFENQSYFSKVFKKYMGLSPSKYSH